MKEKIKSLFQYLIIFIILLIPLYMAPTAKADSGWDSSYGGGSSWSGGGGSSWSGGGGYSGGYSGGSSWSDSSGDSYGTVELDGEFFLIIIIFIIFVCLIFCTQNQNPRNHQNEKNRYLTYAFDEISEAKLQQIIQNANIDQLRQELFQNFLKVQNAWMDFKYDELRTLCTDELYNSYKAQLETLKIKDGQNIMHDFELVDIKIIEAKEVNDEIIVRVFMCVEFFDYVINSKTKQITRGTDKYKLLNNYVMTFVMKAEKGKAKATKCPNCGAKMKIVTSGKCEYCDSTIVTKASEFVLSEKHSVNK